MLEHERKRCPKCGHSNRVTAKNCTQCGFAFFLENTSGMLRKRCPQCGHMNRLGAKICSQCGNIFQNTVTPLAARPHEQKWCPQCGARRRDTAKVCSFCGYRFKVIAAEPPVVQSPDLAEPITVHNVTSTTLTPTPPKPPDLSGEPAPYLTPEELNRLRRLGGHNPGLFTRLFEVMRDDKR